MLCRANKKILKTEWNRVRKGEPAFIWAKRGALGIISSLLLVSFASLYDTVFVANDSDQITAETSG
jgi:hypothetical protein